MKKIYFFFILFPMFSISQNQKAVDELLEKLKNSPKDNIEKVGIYSSLSRAYYYVSNPKKQIEYANLGYNLATTLKYQLGQADCKRFESSAYYSTGNFKDAENSFNISLKIYEEIKNIKGIMACLSNLGTLNTVQNKYSNALNYYQKAIKIAAKNNEEATLATINGNIGVIYSELKNYELALKYFRDGLSAHTKIKSKEGIANCLANIGNVYFQEKKYDKALLNYQEALEKNIEIENKIGIAQLYGNIANVYLENKDFNSSFENNTKALDINEKIKNKKGIAVNYQGIANYYFNEGKDYKKALNYAKKANLLANEIGLNDVQKESAENMSNIYEKLGKTDSAYIYYKKFVERKDFIDNENTRKQINRLEVQYEFDNKEAKYINEQLLSASRLNQQELVLKLNQSKLIESDKQNSITSLNYLNTRSELINTQLIKKTQQKEISISKNKIELRDKEIKINKLSLEAKEKQKWLFVAGIGFLAIIGGLLFYQSRKRKLTNLKLETLNKTLDQNNLKLETLNKDLDQANKAKTRFFGILNHDLRGPVANLIFFLQLQKDSPEMLDAESIKRMQDKTMTGAENLLESMEDILQWSKSQMENFKPQPKNIAINQLFNDTKKVFSGYLNIKIEYQNPANIEIFTDDNYLKTIIRNLTSNAINVLVFPSAVEGQFPTIIWKAWQNKNQSFLSITDNGPGVDADKLKALFDDVDVTSTKSGLGLHLIRDMAKAINCEISVKSEIGVGTTFTLKI